MVYVTRLVQESTRKKAAEKERMAASALLTWVVRRELPEWAGKDARELLVYGPHGKPFLKGNPFYFNLSHSGGIVACAVQTCEVCFIGVTVCECVVHGVLWVGHGRYDALCAILRKRR